MSSTRPTSTRERGMSDLRHRSSQRISPLRNRPRFDQKPDFGFHLRLS